MNRTVTTMVVTMLFMAFPMLSTGKADEYAKVRDTIDACDVCHGPHGTSRDDAFPILAGQEFFYLYTQLKDFQQDKRENAIMVKVLRNLDRSTLIKLSQYYAEQNWPTIDFRGDPATIATGKLVAERENCAKCHTNAYTGANRLPHLAGQHPDYLEKAMLEIKSKARANTPTMSKLMDKISDAEIAALAEYLGSLKN